MSKGLEALQDLSKMVFIYGGVEQYKTIEKELKALEIVKNKKVYIEELFESFKDGLGLSYYNSEYLNYHLTQEEYDLLKEVLL